MCFRVQGVLELTHPPPPSLGGESIGPLFCRPFGAISSHIYCRGLFPAETAPPACYLTPLRGYFISHLLQGFVSYGNGTACLLSDTPSGFEKLKHCPIN